MQATEEDSGLSHKYASQKGGAGSDCYVHHAACANLRNLGRQTCSAEAHLASVVCDASSTPRGLGGS